jgi:flagellar motor switch protein FliN/FliY
MADMSLESMSALAQVPLTLRAELGRRSISGRELLQLHEGSIVPLPMLAGENVHLYAEDVLLGTGEVLALDSCMGVRIDDLLGGDSD